MVTYSFTLQLKIPKGKSARGRRGILPKMNQAPVKTGQDHFESEIEPPNLTSVAAVTSTERAEVQPHTPDSVTASSGAADNFI